MKEPKAKYIIGAVISLLVLLPALLYYNSVAYVDVTIMDKENVVMGSGEDIRGSYLVYTENETFENADNLLFFKFNSADVQGRLEIGQTYNIKVVGWRIPFLNMYRNILEIE